MPSILIKSLNFFVLANEIKFFIDNKFFEINFAFSRPICRIPKAKINLSREIVFFDLLNILN